MENNTATSDKFIIDIDNDSALVSHYLHCVNTRFENTYINDAKNILANQSNKNVQENIISEPTIEFNL